MIIQEHATAYRFISQHDHGRISGLFAQAWRDPVTGERASDALICATYLHDILWVPIDLLPRFLDGIPLDFIAFPETDKLAAYAHGIVSVSSVDAYMGLLHARHFSEFVSRERHPRFRSEMDALIAELAAKITPIERARAADDLALLRLFDVFSLLLCMTGPHIARKPPPWLDPSPLLVRRGLEAFWPAPDQFSIGPRAFEQPFSVRIPYREVPKDLAPAKLLEAVACAPLAWQEVRVRAPSSAEVSARQNADVRC